MTDNPAIFSAPMVRALLDGRKTMTRRLAWRDHHLAGLDFSSEELEGFDALGWNVERRGELYYVSKPSLLQRVKPGDRLYVKESFTTRNDGSRACPKIVPMFAADFPGFDKPERDWNWTAGRFMNRRYSRLTLIVTATKIERLQDISEGDAALEGCPGRLGPNPNFPDEWDPTPQEEFRDLWRSLHGPDSWDANPEVVALTFEVHKANIDAAEARVA